MFTGLVRDLGTVKSARRTRGLVRLTVEPDTTDVKDLELGESISHGGICLTVVSLSARAYDVELGAETLARTTAGSWRAGHRVNLERSLRLGDRLGGHLVLGHVDGVGTVRRRREHDGVVTFSVEMPGPIAPLVCEKGSIAVDGTSLTVNAVTRDRFEVTLIPETLKRTTLSSLAVGSPVNLEADILARHLLRLVEMGTSAGVDLETLRRLC